MPPTLLFAPQPAYPEAAAQAHIEGIVELELLVDDAGRVTNVKVLQSLGGGLDEVAVESARAFRFSPARAAERPVACTIHYHYHFKLPPQPPAPAAAARTSSTARAAATATSAAGRASSAGAPLPPVITRAAAARRSASEVVRDRAVLQAAPHRSADELLFVVPGIFITQHSGEGKAFQIFYRGFDAVHGQDLEIWAGGAPVNDVSNIHGQGYADLHFLPVEIVREIHASPGSYDPHQGDFAVAGTLHFDLGYDRPGITAKAEGGTFGTRRLFLAYRPDGAPESTFGAMELYHTTGFGPSRAADRASALAQWVHSIGEGSDLRLFASAYAGQFASAGVVRLSDVEDRSIDRFATYDPTQGGSSSRSQLVVELEHHDTEARWSLASYLVLRSLRLRDNFTGFLKSPNGDSEQQLNTDIVAGAHGSYRRKLHLFSDRDGIEARFFARTDWIEQSQRRLSVVDASVTANEVDARVRGHDIAGYLDVAAAPIPPLTLRGGIRLDGLGYFTEDRGGAASGQARSSQGAHIGLKGTIDFRIVSGLNALLSYGDGFRSPQARSLSEGQTTPFTTVHSAEVGLQLSLSWLSASFAAFRTTLSDDLVFDQATTRNERVPATRRLGLSANVESQSIEGLTLAASATFTDAEFAASNEQYHEGDLVPYAPQIVARLDAAFRRPLGQVLGVEVEARAGGAVSVLARRPLPYHQLGHDVILTDARAEIRAGIVEIGIDVFNLLDASWFDGEFVFASRWRPMEAGALVPQRLVTIGAPRTVLASLTVNL